MKLPVKKFEWGDEHTVVSKILPLKSIMITL